MAEVAKRKRATFNGSRLGPGLRRERNFGFWKVGATATMRGARGANIRP
jgi:hypothetical protein